MTPKRYTLVKIGDLLKVPLERRAACLAEVYVGLAQTEAVCARLKPLEGKLPSWLKWIARPRLRSFTWIDDGKHNDAIMTPWGTKLWQREDA